MSTIDCVKPTLDPEKLPISEKFSSCHQKAVPLLSGHPAGTFPWDLAQGKDLSFFTSSYVLSINSSLEVT